MTLLIVFFLVSIVFSFLCSIWEAVLLSMTPSFIESEAQAGSTKGVILQSFKDNIDRPLAAILTLNTIAHTVGAIGVGAQAGKLWGADSWSVLGFALNAEAMIAIFMTLAILILSEIIPKTIGANNWKALSGFTASGVNMIIYVLYPLVWVAQWITKWMKKDKNKSVFSRNDISAMASIGVKTGTLDEKEYSLLQNVLAFRSVKVTDIMTPRTVMVSAQEDTTIETFFNNNLDLKFSRIPIYKNDIDDVTGYVLKNDVYEAMIKGKGQEQLKSIKRDLMFYAHDSLVTEALEKMVNQREHIIRIVGEYGGTAGILSLEDIMETLLGLEILDEVDATADMQELARKRWENLKRSSQKD